MSKIEPKEFELKNGEEVIIRSGEAEDAQAMFEYFKVIFGENEFFVTTLDELLGCIRRWALSKKAAG